MLKEPKPKQPVKPLFLIKPGTMTPKDIRRAEKYAGIVIAECADAEAARLLEPPVDADVPLQARAALDLMRHVVGYGDLNTNFGKPYLMRWFLNAIIEAKKPDVVPVVKRK